MATVTCHSSEKTKPLGRARTNLILVIRPFARYGKNGLDWRVWEMREVGLEWSQKEKRTERKRNSVNGKGAGKAECTIAWSTVLIFPSMVSSKVSVLSHPDTLNLPFVHGEAPSCRDARWGGTGGRWNLLVTSMVSILPPVCPPWPAPPIATIHPVLQWERPGTPRFGTAPYNEPLWMAWMWRHCSTRGH